MAFVQTKASYPTPGCPIGRKYMPPGSISLCQGCTRKWAYLSFGIHDDDDEVIYKLEGDTEEWMSSIESWYKSSSGIHNGYHKF